MAEISVRLHGIVAVALLALSAPLALLAALRVRAIPGDAHLFALLGGLTLVAQAIAFAYLPSFTKREVSLEGMARYAGPILFPVALAGAALALDGVRATAPALGLAIFGLILLLTPFVGVPWRDAPPFWQVPGAYRAGDIAAALTLAASALLLLAAGAAALFAPTLLAILWPGALALFALGALAHYVPRNRGRPMLVIAYAVGAAAALAGFALRAAGLASATPLLVGLAIAGLALAPPAATKKAGARMGEAAPFLALAVPFAALAVGLAVAGAGIGFAYASYYALLAAVALALAGLALLLLPVVFNQRPARRWMLPSVLLALFGLPTLAAGFLTALPRWPGAAMLCASLACWLAMMAPLRQPRRECPP